MARKEDNKGERIKIDKRFADKLQIERGENKRKIVDETGRKEDLKNNNFKKARHKQ